MASFPSPPQLSDILRGTASTDSTPSKKPIMMSSTNRMNTPNRFVGASPSSYHDFTAISSKDIAPVEIVPTLSLRWRGVSRALYHEIVVDSYRSASNSQVLALLDSIDRRVDEFLTEGDFADIMRDWRVDGRIALRRGMRDSPGKSVGSGSPASQRRKRPVVSFSSFVAMLSTRGYQYVSDLELRLALVVNEQNRFLLLTAKLESMTPEWLAVAEKIFFLLDTMNMCMLSANEISSLAMCLSVTQGSMDLNAMQVSSATYKMMDKMAACSGTSCGLVSMLRFKRYLIAKRATEETLNATVRAICAHSELWRVLRTGRADSQSSLNLDAKRAESMASRESIFIPQLWLCSVCPSTSLVPDFLDNSINSLESFLIFEAPRIIWEDEAANIRALRSVTSSHSIVSDEFQARSAAKLWKTFKKVCQNRASPYAGASSAGTPETLDALVRDSQARRLVSSITRFAAIRKYACHLVTMAIADGTVARILRKYEIFDNKSALTVEKLEKSVPMAFLKDSKERSPIGSEAFSRNIKLSPAPEVAEERDETPAADWQEVTFDNLLQITSPTKVNVSKSTDNPVVNGGTREVDHEEATSLGEVVKNLSPSDFEIVENAINNLTTVPSEHSAAQKVDGSRMSEMRINYGGKTPGVQSSEGSAPVAAATKSSLTVTVKRVDDVSHDIEKVNKEVSLPLNGIYTVATGRLLKKGSGNSDSSGNLLGVGGRRNWKDRAFSLVICPNTSNDSENKVYALLKYQVHDDDGNLLGAVIIDEHSYVDRNIEKAEKYPYCFGIRRGDVPKPRISLEGRFRCQIDLRARDSDEESRWLAALSNVIDMCENGFRKDVVIDKAEYYVRARTEVKDSGYSNVIDNVEDDEGTEMLSLSQELAQSMLDEMDAHELSPSSDPPTPFDHSTSAVGLESSQKKEEETLQEITSSSPLSQQSLVLNQSQHDIFDSGNTGNHQLEKVIKLYSPAKNTQLGVSRVVPAQRQANSTGRRYRAKKSPVAFGRRISNKDERHQYQKIGFSTSSFDHRMEEGFTEILAKKKSNARKGSTTGRSPVPSRYNGTRETPRIAQGRKTVTPGYIRQWKRKQVHSLSSRNNGTREVNLDLSGPSSYTVGTRSLSQVPHRRISRQQTKNSWQ